MCANAFSVPANVKVLNVCKCFFSSRKCQGADEHFLNAETWGQKQKDRPR